jgi:hypothetical protein
VPFPVLLFGLSIHARPTVAYPLRMALSFYSSLLYCSAGVVDREPHREVVKLLHHSVLSPACICERRHSTLAA